MTAQQGFLYEENAAKFLKKYKIVPENFRPAGAGHNQPDLIIVKNKKEAGCELKITAASAGSLVLKYDQTKKNPWGFGDIKDDEKEKMFIADLAKEIKLFDFIKKSWTALPNKRVQDELWKKQAGKKTPRRRYEEDLANFKDISIDIPTSKIEQYYNHKDTYYLNIGTHGFYLMGNSNPLKLKDVPLFSNSAKAKGRARVQYKGSDNYQFTFEMQFGSIQKSPFNIAPLDGKSVNIVLAQANLGCF